MAEYGWPTPEERSLIGRRIARVDGPDKVTGRARFTHDVRREGLLYARILRCPHARARIRHVDVSAAREMPGVKAVRVIQDRGAEVQWALDEVAVVAATSDRIARDAVRAIRVHYEVLPHFVQDAWPDAAPTVREGTERVSGDPDAALAAAAVKVEGRYGLPSVAHACPEPHGQVSEWSSDGSLTVWCSTQAVRGMVAQLAEALDVPASKVRVIAEHVGGAFGSKFGPDRWGVECARLARETRAPVKLMLDREAEHGVAGDRPSAHARVTVGAAEDGTITGWDSRSWGSGGLAGSGSPPLPYVFQIPDRRQRHVSVPTNVAGSRAWRAPNHPQACLITMAALDDLAARLGRDPLDLFLQNVGLTGRRAGVYREELGIAADLMGWRRRWHPRGRAGDGPLKRGLGLSLHTWGGRGHRSTCEVVVHPDGAVEAKLGSQDIGTGTRTVVAIAVAETFGLPVEAVRVQLGDSRYPTSGTSGGSTTAGGVGSAARRAALDAREELLYRAAASLGVPVEELVLGGGELRFRDSERALSFERATGLLGGSPITATGKNPGQGRLTDSGVGGVQMADVSVDVETGVVRVEKMVAVQDCGLVLDLQTAESQVRGAMIMGIGTALSEEKIIDPVSGRMLNAELDAYRFCGIGDYGELVVHMMTGPGYDERGVIGVGEPPVISPCAAISNGVANAIGVRVPTLPLTPDRVLAALESARSDADEAGD
jgi:xanthine dehydrogenase YagR molybdenum-binding subunit